MNEHTDNLWRWGLLFAVALVGVVCGLYLTILGPAFRFVLLGFVLTLGNLAAIAGLLTSK